ncbi:MAG TPA: YraN family protein [Gemmatimonadales bacterium]|nr:YraN family protein [Gemmatimonadales bacterium]
MSPTRDFVPNDEWSDPRHKLGLSGEHLAIAFFTSCGWEVEGHRFRCAGHDLDLVIRRGKTVAFVEVKTRARPGPDEPLAAIGSRKRKAIARAAECWRLRFGRRDDEYRFDVLVVTGRDEQRKIEHLADAWRILR